MPRRHTATSIQTAASDGVAGAHTYHGHRRQICGIPSEVLAKRAHDLLRRIFPINLEDLGPLRQYLDALSFAASIGIGIAETAAQSYIGTEAGSCFIWAAALCNTCLYLSLGSSLLLVSQPISRAVSLPDKRWRNIFFHFVIAGSSVASMAMMIAASQIFGLGTRLSDHRLRFAGAWIQITTGLASLWVASLWTTSVILLQDERPQHGNVEMRACVCRCSPSTPEGSDVQQKVAEKQEQGLLPSA